MDSYRNLTRDYWETKAVYAQVYPTVDKITFTPGETSVRIPIQNDFDFTNLSTVKINWSIKEDEKELSSGIGSINAEPHTESNFELPLNQLKIINPAQTYYVWLIFTNADGMEINRKSVELYSKMQRTEIIPVGKLSVVKSGNSTTVNAGDAQYIFNLKKRSIDISKPQGKSIDYRSAPYDLA